MTSNTMSLRAKYLLVLMQVLFIFGCAAIRPPSNTVVTEKDDESSYRRESEKVVGRFGDTLVILSFSGGGTRAAALSYGVLQELRDTVFIDDRETPRLLDEVDLISSVSGGSFTSAYYGLYRDKIFDDFEDEFLRLGVQEALIWQLFNPMHWLRSSFSGFDRTEMAIDYYDRKIFKGATFADLSQNGKPYIDINATDLTTGLRFTFTQDIFDLICSDMSEYSVARAVTASSAVPIAFPTVVLKNYANECSGAKGLEALTESELRADTEAQKEIVSGLKSLRNAQKRRIFIWSMGVLPIT